MSIHADSSGAPGASLRTLSNSGPLGETYRSHDVLGDGIDLEPNTKYFVVIEGDSGNTGDSVSRTSADDEDTGGMSGWSIANERRWRSAGGSAWTTHNIDVLQIAIHGYAKATTLQTAVVNGKTLTLTFNEFLSSTRTSSRRRAPSP